MSSVSENGFEQLEAYGTVAETIDRLAGIVETKGLRVFARIDQQAAAASVGLAMRPTELLLFGNPAAGTQLMIDVPIVAIDLPLKAVAWEDADGKVWIGYNAPAYLKERHGLTDEQSAKLAGIVGLVQSAAARG